MNRCRSTLGPASGLSCLRPLLIYACVSLASGLLFSVWAAIYGYGVRTSTKGPMRRIRPCRKVKSLKLVSRSARRVKRECLAQAGLEQPGRQQPAQPAQESCSADRPSHAVGPFDRSQHFLGDDLRLGRRVGTKGDHCRSPVALRRIGVDPTLRLRSAPVEVGPGIVRLNQPRGCRTRARNRRCRLFHHYAPFGSRIARRKQCLRGGCRFFPSPHLSPRGHTSV